MLKSVAVLIDDVSTSPSGAPILARAGGGLEALLRAALRVLLHALHARQSAHCIARAFAGAADILGRHGARVFLAASRHAPTACNSRATPTSPLPAAGWEAAGDTLQDWLRAAAAHANSTRPVVRCGARDFLLLLLHLTYHAYGSISPVRTPLLAIFKDVLALEGGDLERRRPPPAPAPLPTSMSANAVVMGASAAAADVTGTSSSQYASTSGDYTSTSAAAGYASSAAAPARVIRSVEDAVAALAPLEASLTEMGGGVGAAAAVAAASAPPGFNQRLQALVGELKLVKRAYLLKLR